MWWCKTLRSTLLKTTAQCLHIALDWPSQSKSFTHTSSEIEFGRNIDEFQNPLCLWYMWINISRSLEAPQYISFAKHLLHRNVTLDWSRKTSWKISEIRLTLTIGFILETQTTFLQWDENTNWPQIPPHQTKQDSTRMLVNFLWKTIYIYSYIEK